MKYVIIKAKVTETSLTRSLPILFPNDLSHSEVAAAVIAGCPELKDGKVISAGTLSSLAINPDKIISSGSESLQIKPKRNARNDRHLISMVDYFHGLK